jgi:hypothetical protein
LGRKFAKVFVINLYVYLPVLKMLQYLGCRLLYKLQVPGQGAGTCQDTHNVTCDTLMHLLFRGHIKYLPVDTKHYVETHKMDALYIKRNAKLHSPGSLTGCTSPMPANSSSRAQQKEQEKGPEA